MRECLLVCLFNGWKRPQLKKESKAEIIALPITDALSKMDDWDVVMLGPQVRHELKGLRTKTETPIEVIEMRDYGMMNGEKVLEAAIKVIDAK